MWFFNRNSLFLYECFVRCLLCSCWFLNKNILQTTQKILRHVLTEGVVSQLPLSLVQDLKNIDFLYLSKYVWIMFGQIVRDMER